MSFLSWHAIRTANRVLAYVIYNIWYFTYDCVATTAFRDYSREDGKSPVGGTVVLVQEDTVAAVKREPEIWSTTAVAVAMRACNCVVATVTSLVTSAMQYSEVRVVCVASEHCSRWRMRGQRVEKGR